MGPESVAILPRWLIKTSQAWLTLEALREPSLLPLMAMASNTTGMLVPCLVGLTCPRHC